ncbi:MAG: NADPH nitroreductase [Magnetovibrio sp.]|nr:NADPH nitroreductase [Magnetovibrio sp.]|tara:strand:- start:140 stop:1021 length:882 start_codon:yes stop_codon:yes gene_type:complete
MKPEKLGFVGLGQMGAPMAKNIAKKGLDLSVFDKAGTRERAPDNTSIVDSISALAKCCDTIFLSVPDGEASLSVISEIITTNDRRVTVVIDLSTVGPAAAREGNIQCKEVGITYMDAPVSGGQAGAEAGTISIMMAGDRDTKSEHDEILHAFAKNPFYVGNEPGQGQALKILNNFLSGTAMIASTEAILYGLSQNLEMQTMLNVLNVSTGQNTATSDKFPNRILTETFDAGFATALITKDVNLFIENAMNAGISTNVADTVGRIWNEANDALPDSDFTLVFKHLRDQIKATKT